MIAFTCFSAVASPGPGRKAGSDGLVQSSFPLCRVGVLWDFASEILREKIVSASGCGEIDLPPTQFDLEIRFDLFSSEIWALADTITENVNLAGVERRIPMGHVTLYDGSEQDLWVHYAKIDESILLLELRHHYIDQHFILFHLWHTNRQQDRTYPTDLLFDSDVIGDSLSDGRKVLEFFVKPVTLLIHAKILIYRGTCQQKKPWRGQMR